MDTVTAASNQTQTVYIYTVEWHGHRILMQSDEPCRCDVAGSSLDIMHHVGPDGKHYCPTGELMCSYCVGFADEPEPHSCTKWGEA